MRILILALLTVSFLSAQTEVQNITVTKAIDASAATGVTRPTRTGTAVPGTCSVGELFVKTNATASAQLYVCTATNTYTQQGSTVTRNEIWTWGICTGAVCATGANLTSPNRIMNSGTITGCYADGKTAPTGATLIVDILNAGTSVFGGGTKLVVAAAATSGNQTIVANAAVTAGATLTISITQIGSTVAGQDFTVKCMESY